MLDEDDPRWKSMKGGYGMPVDPRQLVNRTERDEDARDAWSALWEELHHQGDVGEASYAAVPLIVAAHSKRQAADWDPYAIVAIIELARTEVKNPPVPAWISEEYFGAIDDLAKLGMSELADANDPETIRAILSVIALSKGLRVHAKFLVEYSEDEMQSMEFIH